MADKEIAKNTDKKPFYKQVWFWVVVVVLILIVVIVGGSNSGKDNGDTDNKTGDTTNNLEKYLAKPYSEDSAELKIAKSAYERINSKFENTEISKITVNENAGTDNPDDYILLIDLTWNRMNKEDTTKEMVRMYCDDLAAYTVEQNSNVQEIALFWTIPYHKENAVSAKCSYEQKNGKMFLSDKMGLVGDK